MKMFKLFYIFLVLLLSSGVAYGQAGYKGYPQMCVQNADPNNPGTASYETCAQMNAGAAPATPGYQRLQDGNGLSLVDIQGLNLFIGGFQANQYFGMFTGSLMAGLDETTGTVIRGLRYGVGLRLLTAANLDQVNGVATSVGAGNTAVNTMRVVNATNDPNLSALNTFFVTTVGSNAYGDALGVANVGMDVLSYNLFYDGANATRRWTGGLMSTESIANTFYSPYVQNFNFGYDSTSASWRWMSVESTFADNKTYTLNPLATMAVMFADDGANLDMVKFGAGGGITTDRTWAMAGEDAVNDWIKFDSVAINGVAPDVNSGNLSAGTQRVAIATDDVNVKGIHDALDTSGGLDVDINTQSLTAVKISGDASANLVTNPINVASAPLQLDLTSEAYCVAITNSDVDLSLPAHASGAVFEISAHSNALYITCGAGAQTVATTVGNFAKVVEAGDTLRSWIPAATDTCAVIGTSTAGFACFTLAAGY